MLKYLGKLTKEMDKETISIREAANLIGVSTDTLRRWDKNGKLPAIQGMERGHRRYRKEDIDLFLRDLFYLAKKWSSSKDAYTPDEDYYCPDNYIFKSRLDKMEILLSKDHTLQAVFSLITSVVGEIGNNSFDHNLGNWPDIPGIFFAYDLNKKMIVLADRGQGILTTLKRVKPELKEHTQALKVAFTEIITGRAPEHRGNGLKYVKRIVENYSLSMVFHTGNAKLELSDKTDFKIHKCEEYFHGCTALIKYKN